MNKSALNVKSLFRDYTVDFSDDLTEDLAMGSDKNRVYCIIDANVMELHKERMPFISKAVTCIEVEAREEKKTIETVQSIMLKLLNHNISKKDVLVVIGGGLTQDIGAFTAHLLKRGIKWHFIPTTLLAMCDSCIGSKYGLNMANFKNQIGGFWPPSKILIDMAYLETLKREDFISGIGEILKVHLISGEKDFKYLEENYAKMTVDQEILKNLILKSLEIKKKIAEKDEFDADYRQILNYGHTFGHGIEAYSNNQIPHGIAVTIGMEIANFVSVMKGYLERDVFEHVSVILRKYIPYEHLDFSDHQKLVEVLKRDKKFDGKQLNVILSKGIGKIFKDKIDINEDFLSLLDSYTQLYNKLSKTKGTK